MKLEIVFCDKSPPDLRVSEIISFSFLKPAFLIFSLSIASSIPINS